MKPLTVAHGGALLPLLVLLACDSECGPISACEPVTVDLAIERVELHGFPGQQTDSLTGLTVVTPNTSGTVRVMIRNDGDYASAPARLSVCVNLPREGTDACSFGWKDVQVQSVAADAKDTVEFAYQLDTHWNFLLLDTIARLRLDLRPAAPDASAANDTTVHRVLLAQPLLAGFVTHPDTARIGTVIDVTASLNNS
ncbi:MAG: hypothetical protein ACREKM_06225, partial [Longimicrobiales bacterium]